MAVSWPGVNSLEIRWDEYEPLVLALEDAAEGKHGKVAEIIAALVLLLSGLNVNLLEQNPGAIVPLVLAELEQVHRALSALSGGGQQWTTTDRQGLT